jgi:hypothetical protein
MMKIEGSGSTPKCHGSAALRKRKTTPIIKKGKQEFDDTVKVRGHNELP